MNLKNYQEMQKVSRHLSEEIPKLYSFEKIVPKIARLLGIKHGKNIVFESEEEMNFIIDFYLNEYDNDGRTFLEQYREEHPDLDPQQIVYLDAAKNSRTSFFKIIGLNPTEGILTVQDLLNPSEKPVDITNRSLSVTGQIDFIVFSRFLTFSKFNAFSGMYAVFPDNPGLIKKHKIMKRRVKSNKDSIQSFVAAFKLNRTFGIEILTKS